MKNVHLVVCDLFLPKDFAAEVCAGLRLPALEKMLARAAAQAGESASLEKLLCGSFGVTCQLDAPIASISAAVDGLGAGNWLRADPVHLRLQRDQLILLPEVDAGADEAGQLCTALNEHFAGQGMAFFAPHPQRWYMRVDRLPDIETVSLAQAAGCNVRGLLPTGRGAVHWHRVFNEIQMLLFAHGVNEAREARGALSINSLWLWGGGSATPVQKTYDCVSSDEALAEMFAAAAGIPFAGWPKQWNASLTLSQREGGFSSDGRQLLVWTGLRSALQCGDLGAWRAALQEFETGYAQPLWQALHAGKIAQLRLDVLGRDCARRSLLTRADSWAFWRRARPLTEYAIV